jgi:D-alanyl-D-alanine carboxypeptidase (penicillin-binding protein 5/6)
VVYRGPVQAPVEKGTRIGKLKIWRGERVALEVELEAGESVPTGSVVGRAVDAAGELVGGLLRKGVSKL